MKPEEEYLDVLQNIEAVVVTTWKKHPEMTDYAVLRAYEAAITHYKALARGGTPKPEHLTGLDAKVYAVVHDICEWRLGHKTTEASVAAEEEDADPTPIPLEGLLDCLRRLRKSVERWNRTGGSRGYLEFVGQFVG